MYSCPIPKIKFLDYKIAFIYYRLLHMTPDITAVCSLIRIMIEIKSHTGLSVCWAPASSDNYVTKHVSGSCVQECGWQPGWLPCLEDREHAGGPHSKWGMGQILFWRCLHHPFLSSFWNKAIKCQHFCNPYWYLCSGGMNVKPGLHNGRLEQHIHFWLGEEASTDEVPITFLLNMKYE